MAKNNALRIIAASVALAMAGTAAHAAKVPAGVKLAAKQELIRNIGSEPESLDPMLAESVPANTITADLFEGLTALDASNNVVPGVAESWKQTNPTTWVFKLRKNAKWSNGEPVTAADFVAGWQHLVDPKLASPYANTFGDFIVNGTEITQGKKPLSELGVKALDAYTLEVKTVFPVVFMPGLVANTQFAPLPRATFEKYGKDWTKPGKMVSNGAMMLQSWDVNSKVVAVKNPHYWDAKNVQLTKSTYIEIEDGSQDVKMFESGENDYVLQLPPDTFEKFKTQYPKELRNGPFLGLRYYSLNNKDPLLKDVRVRKALSMVLDRDLLAKKVTADGQVPAYSAVVAGTLGTDVTTYDWVKWPMAQRVAEAKKLLAAAGVKPGTKLSFTYNTSDYHKKMAIFAASEWKNKLGLDTQMESLEFKVLLKRRHDGQFQIARNGWNADYNDATSFTALIQCGNTQNDNGNCNKKGDDLINQANNTLDPAKRKQLMTQGVKTIMDDYPMIPLLQYTAPRLVKSYVGGYTGKSAQDRYRAKDLYIIQH